MTSAAEQITGCRPSESARVPTRLEFYLPGGRHFTLIKRDTWFGLVLEVMKGARCQ